MADGYNLKRHNILNNMDIIEAIEERRSVRTFNGVPVSPDMRAKLVKSIADAHDPFGGRVTIRLKEFDNKREYRPGTYGIIRGAVDFFLIGMADDVQSALSVGFIFEQIILHAKQLGLGTCWIGATFNSSDFDRDEIWPDGEQLKIVCPVGIAKNPGIVEKLARLAVRSNGREPFDELFRNADRDSTRIGHDNRFRKALEMMRLAPSSANSQPWRAIVDGLTVHFYCRQKNSWSMLDCGIGLCHFSLTEIFYGHDGKFAETGNRPDAPSGWRYITSYSASV